jgi:hypothetical protein
VKDSLNEKRDIMDGHQINKGFRASMVSWMMNVFKSFDLSDQTFFVAVNIMDRFFE